MTACGMTLNLLRIRPLSMSYSSCFLQGQEFRWSLWQKRMVKLLLTRIPHQRLRECCVIIRNKGDVHKWSNGRAQLFSDSHS